MKGEVGFPRPPGVCEEGPALPRRPAVAVPAVAVPATLAEAPPAKAVRPSSPRAAARPEEHGPLHRWWIGAAAAAIAVAGAAIVWDAVKYDFIAKRFGVVEEGKLFRSGQISAALFAPTVRDHGIDTVLCLMGNATHDVDHVAEVAAVEEMPDVTFQRFPLRGDGTGDFDTYQKALASLALARRANRTVLVHCSAGAQRTGSIVAAYRLLVKRDDPAEVYAELGRYGWEPKDAAMLDYLNAHLPECARMLHDRGLIAEIPDPIPVLGP